MKIRSQVEVLRSARRRDERCGQASRVWWLANGLVLQGMDLNQKPTHEVFKAWAGPRQHARPLGWGLPVVATVQPTVEGVCDRRKTVTVNGQDCSKWASGAVHIR